MLLRMTYDRDADAAYIWLRDEAYAYGEDLDPARRIDYASDGRPLGVELLNVSDGVNLDDLPEQAAIRRTLEAHHFAPEEERTWER